MVLCDLLVQEYIVPYFSCGFKTYITSKDFFFGFIYNSEPKHRWYT